VSTQLNITDRPGVISKVRMREHFERAIKDTPAFQKNTPLCGVEINGEFSHYLDPDTDTMWLGFAIGMRCAERLSRSASSQPTPEHT